MFVSDIVVAICQTQIAIDIYHHLTFCFKRTDETNKAPRTIYILSSTLWMNILDTNNINTYFKDIQDIIYFLLNPHEAHVIIFLFSNSLYRETFNYFSTIESALFSYIVYHLIW